MSVNKKMTAIADAIREKTGGTEALTLDDMAEFVLTLPYSGIPSYHYAEASRVIENIQAFKKRCPNNIVFGTVSDNHIYANNTTYKVATKTSIRHGAFALETVGNIAGCDFVANLGDNCWENGSGTDNGYEGSLYVKKALRSAFSRMPCYSLVGNHDKNDNTNTVFELIGSFNEFDDYGLTQKRCYGYKDFTDKKVRVICLNTCDYLNASGGNGMSYEQKDWLMRSLDLSDKSDASSWQILILSHIPINFTGGDYNKYSDLESIFTAYVNGTTATVAVNSSYALNETPSGYSTYSGGNLVYNYSGKNSAKIIGNIAGHTHTNYVGTWGDLGIPIIITPNTCFYLNKTESYPDNGDYSITFDEASKLVKTSGTAKDTSATFYCIDLDEQVIYAFGYGANTDRTVIYKDVPVYGITYNLTLCTSGNTANKVAEGSAFITTIAPNAGVELKSVIVTMDGVDITSDVYNNGVISIAEITGNIVITAVAETVASYTNLFDSTAIEAPTRFNSSGDIVSGNYWCMSTYLACNEGDIIRVYCPDGLWSDHVQRVIATYDSSKSHASSDKYAQNGTMSADGHLITFTIPSGVSFVRVSGVPHDNYNDSIITINEEIGGLV